MTAYCLIRQQPHYRHDAFIAGLRAAGYTVNTHAPIEGRPGDVLVIWNRYGTNEQIADRFEKDGGTVLVCENGYIGKDQQGRQLYAIAKKRHNGGGWWPHMDGGDSSRWDALGIELQSYRPGALKQSHILVCGNRSFGTRGNIMPIGWEKDVRYRIAKSNGGLYDVRLRFHPGNDEPAVPLAKDFENCLAVVIWSSSCGVHALVAGIPVICEAKWWICKSAAADDLDFSSMNTWLDRKPAMNALAWAQWTVDEITQGLPFKHLCTSTAPATSTA